MYKNLIFLILLIISLGSSSLCYSQENVPVSFEEILVLPDCGYNAAEIIEFIQNRGLSFEVCKAHIDSLKNINFYNSVIRIIKQFYAMGIINITTNPAETDIFIDNKLKGTSDKKGYYQLELSIGDYEIKFQKDGFVSIDTAITVERNKTYDAAFTLKEQLGFLTVEVNPSDAKIIVKADSLEYQLTYGIEVQLPPILLVISLSAEGYEPMTLSFKLKGGDHQTLPLIHLNRLPASSSLRKISALLYYGLSLSSPKFDDDTHWENGHNWVINFSAKLSPLFLADIDFNSYKFNKFEALSGDDFGYFKGFGFSIVPGVYYEHNGILCGYAGIGVGWNKTTIENGEFIDNEVIFSHGKKDKKNSLAFIYKAGLKYYIGRKPFVFVEYKGYQVGGQFAMGL